MTTNTHPIAQDELMAYLDGELPTDRATVAVAHLDHCPECQMLAAEFRGVSRQLMTWEVEAPEPVIQPVVLAALEEHEGKSEEKREQKPQRSTSSSRLASLKSVMMHHWIWAGAFAVLCVIVGLSLKNRNFELRPMNSEIETLREPKTVQHLRKEQIHGYFTPATPPTDSNGLFNGLGDHAENSFSLDGQPPVDADKALLPDQSAKLQNPSVAGPMVVRTAGLSLTTNDFDRARAALDEILKRHHGYVGQLNVSTPTGSGRSFNATLRVPSDQLDATIADLRKLGKVESESQSGEEVTAQYVDLVARLANARHTEDRLTDLLRQRTGKLSDVLAVENEIDRVRGEIERMEAERKNLANQVDFATINATMTEDYKVPLQLAPVSTPSRIRNAAVEGYRAMVESMVGVVLFLFSYGPSLLVWGGILFFPVRAVWRKVRRTFARQL
jgi:hypothetical protein